MAQLMRMEYILSRKVIYGMVLVSVVFQIWRYFIMAVVNDFSFADFASLRRHDTVVLFCYAVFYIYYSVELLSRDGSIRHFTLPATKAEKFATPMLMTLLSSIFVLLVSTAIVYGGGLLLAYAYSPTGLSLLLHPAFTIHTFAEHFMLFFWIVSFIAWTLGYVRLHARYREVVCGTVFILGLLGILFVPRWLGNADTTFLIRMVMIVLMSAVQFFYAYRWYIRYPMSNLNEEDEE